MVAYHLAVFSHLEQCSKPDRLVSDGCRGSRLSIEVILEYIEPRRQVSMKHEAEERGNELQPRRVLHPEQPCRRYPGSSDIAQFSNTSSPIFMTVSVCIGITA